MTKDKDGMPDDLYKQLLELARPSQFNIASVYKDVAASKVQTQVGILDRFSVAETISAMAREIESVTQNNPDKRFIVTMRTPDGRVMLIESIRPVGFSAYVAQGFIDDLKCMVTGHVSTLSVFIAVDDGQSKKPVGYTAKPATVFQPESEQSESDKTQSDR